MSPAIPKKLAAKKVVAKKAALKKTVKKSESPPEDEEKPWRGSTEGAKLCRIADNGIVSIDYVAENLERFSAQVTQEKLKTPVSRETINEAKRIDRAWWKYLNDGGSKK
jgi:hypothetical protein